MCDNDLKKGINIDDSFEIKIIQNIDEIRCLSEEIKTVDVDFLCKVLNNVDFPITMVVNWNYVDRLYRDSYYIYLSSKHFEHQRNCIRICIFKGEYDLNDFFALKVNSEKFRRISNNFIGVSVVRPAAVPYIQRTIGRTLLDPDKLNIGDFKICTTDFMVNILGKTYKINAFPFMSQDSEVMKCAETTVWGIMEFFGTDSPLYKTILPSDIIKKLIKFPRRETYLQMVLLILKLLTCLKFLGSNQKYIIT